MTIRARSSDDALSAFSAITAGHGLHPILGVQTARYGGTYVSKVDLQDPVFCSPWWGHASGSQLGGQTNLSACLASAYGELIENVSCDLWYPDWLSCRRDVQAARDEQRVSLDECLATLPPKTGLRETMEMVSSRVLHRVHPYVSVTNPDTVLLFPREIGLEVVGRNNGAAVGLERTEAIVAALLEIFERHVARKLTLRTETFPLIDPAIFQTGAVADIVAKLEQDDSRTFFVDMTLGGRLPVLGVLIINGSHGRLSAAIAGGDQPQSAVEHCLREMLCDDYYQASVFGFDTNADAADVLRTWSRCGFSVGWGGSLEQIAFHKPYSTKFLTAFQHGAADAHDLLKWCLNICQCFGADIYVRDCATLGIPAVHVYADHLSEYSFVAHEGLMSVRDNAQSLAQISRDRWLHHYLPLLDRCMAGDSGASEELGAVLDNPFAGFPDVEDVCDYFSWPVSTELDSRLDKTYRGVSLTRLVAGLRYHAADFEQAAALWRRAEGSDGALATSVGHLLELAARLQSLTQAKNQFTSAFGEVRLERVEHALSLDSLLKIPLVAGSTEIEAHWQDLRSRLY